MASTEPTLSEARQTSVVVYPVDPGNSEQIYNTEGTLGRVCGPQHVKSNLGEDGRMSWTLKLTDPRVVTIVADHPHIRWDDSTTKTLLDFYWGEENPLPGVSYNVVSSDKLNDAETKATRDFLEQKSVRPEDIIDFGLPGTGHVIGWGNVRLDGAAKSEVERYPGVKPPLGVNWPVEDG